MDREELLRRIGQNVSEEPQTDWAGRINAGRIEIESAIHRQPPRLSNKARRRMEAEFNRNPERR